MLRITLVFTIIGLLFASCTRTLKPSKPVEFYTDKQLANRESKYQLSFQLSVNRLQRFVQTSVPDLLYDDKEKTDDGVLLRVERKGEAKITANNETLVCMLPLKVVYDIDRTQYVLGMPISIKKKGELTMSPLIVVKILPGKSWEESMEVVDIQLRWDQKPKVKVGPVEVELESLLQPIIESNLKRVKTLVKLFLSRQESFEPLFVKSYSSMIKPIVYDFLGQKAYLKIEPKSLQLGDLQLAEGKIIGMARIKATVSNTIGTAPRSEFKVQVPRLDPFVSDTSKHFGLYVLNLLSYEWIERSIVSYFDKNPIEYEGRKVEVKDIQVFGSGDKLVVEAKVRGAAKGTLYIEGTPKVDTVKNSVYLENVDFSVNTKNILTRTAGFVLRGPMLSQLRSAARYDLQQVLTQSKPALESALAMKGEGWIWSHSLKELSVRELLVTNEGLQALIFVKGSATWVWNE